jgi:uncharacterized membrane protein
LRTTVGLAALIARRNDGLRAVFRFPAARAAAACAVGAELVFDKLPTTGSRLEPRPLAGRVLFAGLTAAALARSEQESPVAAVAVASGATLAAAKTGYELRAALDRRLPDTMVAVAEDALAIGLATRAA